MPLTPQVASEFDFKGLIFFIKSWRKCAFGQIASSFGALLIQHSVVILGETIFWGLKSTKKLMILST
ncbi:hypothetical protein LOK49_LG13G02058 [Camellia lanceoleosa]|uniref:Uncharacterized protein n=1 Tax=Camellia lanceoleosa TaxID=1840588 RepID=A0ACC0FF77_9ERIC|nr:hypothetical protein LOK49_LG13G02058 [Camellia lanceoleosa]